MKSPNPCVSLPLQQAPHYSLLLCPTITTEITPGDLKLWNKTKPRIFSDPSIFHICSCRIFCRSASSFGWNLLFCARRRRRVDDTSLTLLILARLVLTAGPRAAGAAAILNKPFRDASILHEAISFWQLSLGCWRIQVSGCKCFVNVLDKKAPRDLVNGLCLYTCTFQQNSKVVIFTKGINTIGGFYIIIPFPFF